MGTMNKGTRRQGEREKRGQERDTRDKEQGEMEKATARVIRSFSFWCLSFLSKAGEGARRADEVEKVPKADEEKMG
jgi:hypothetical protein